MFCLAALVTLIGAL